MIDAISRHRVVYHVAPEASAPHRWYIDRKKEKVISNINSSKIISAKFAVEISPRSGNQRTKFEEIAQANPEIRASKTSFQFLCFFIYHFTHLV